MGIVLSKKIKVQCPQCKHHTEIVAFKLHYQITHAKQAKANVMLKRGTIKFHNSFSGRTINYIGQIFIIQ